MKPRACIRRRSQEPAWTDEVVGAVEARPWAPPRLSRLLKALPDPPQVPGPGTCMLVETLLGWLAGCGCLSVSAGPLLAWAPCPARGLPHQQLSGAIWIRGWPHPLGEMPHEPPGLVRGWGVVRISTAGRVGRWGQPRAGTHPEARAVAWGWSKRTPLPRSCPR